MQWLRIFYRQSAWTEIAFAVIVMLAGAVILLSIVIEMLSLSGLLSEAVAAWVGALGTIGAIAGSFAIGRHQAKAALDQARTIADEERAKRIGGYRAVVSYVNDMCVQIAAGLSDGGPEPGVLRFAWDITLRSEATSAARAFDAIPLHEIGGKEIILAAAGLRNALGQMITHMEAWMQAPELAIEPLVRARRDIDLQRGFAARHWEVFSA